MQNGTEMFLNYSRIELYVRFKTLLSIKFYHFATFDYIVNYKKCSRGCPIKDIASISLCQDSAFRDMNYLIYIGL